MVDRSVIPRDYGRGREGEWVDIDNDGINELYIGNADTPNSLLVRDRGTERYTDFASRSGLGFISSGVFAWADINDDGYQDLVLMAPDALVVVIDRDGARFEVQDVNH